jgi:hypothetical protein
MLHGKSNFVFCLLLVAGSLSGCGYSFVSPRTENPIIIDSANEHTWTQGLIGTVGTTADRRLAFIRLGPIKPDGTGRFCAEPPPDVAQNVAREIASALNVKIKDQVEFGGSFDSRSSIVAQILLARSQGIQYMRDSMFNLCLAHMNGMINNEQYLNQLEQTMARGGLLIRVEIERSLSDSARSAAAAVGSASNSLLYENPTTVSSK